MKKIVILIVILIVVLAAGSFGYFKFFKKSASQPDVTSQDKRTVLEVAKDSGQQDFTFGGDIKKLTSTDLVFYTGRVVRKETGNEFVNEDKTVTFDDKTVYYFTTAATGVNTPAKRTDLKVGQKILVTTSDYEKPSMLASEIQIIR